MKVMNVPCRDIRYKEFPDLLFGTSREDGSVYFDATRFIRARGDGRRHNLPSFRAAFHPWILAQAEAYGIRADDLYAVDEASGHLLIDECLDLLFITYIDPRFGVYMQERMSELLTGGFSVSDTWLAHEAGRRFTNEELTQITRDYEK